MIRSMTGDGRDSNSPSPNHHTLPLGSIVGDDNSDLEAGSVFGGGSTLAGQGECTSVQLRLVPFLVEANSRCTSSARADGS